MHKDFTVSSGHYEDIFTIQKKNSHPSQKKMHTLEHYRQLSVMQDKRHYHNIQFRILVPPRNLKADIVETNIPQHSRPT